MVDHLSGPSHGLPAQNQESRRHALVSRLVTEVFRPALVGACLMIAVAGCNGPGIEQPNLVAAPVAPDPVAALEAAAGLEVAAGRAVVISTTACGHAPATQGSGVAVSPGRVLTAAHVVAGASEIRVGPPVDRSGSSNLGAGEQAGPGEDRRPSTATVVAYDSLRDLALLEVELDGTATVDGSVDFAVQQEGQAGVIVGAATSGDIDYTVAEKTIIAMDEVRGTRRSRRSGYLLDAVTAPGDSGSGLYDHRGRLTGLLFAVSRDDGHRSWATAADEVEKFLADDTVTGSFDCNSERSRLERRVQSN